MNEIWKDIEGYEGYYQVSNTGRVKTLNRVVTQKNGTKKKLKERILKPAKCTNGYLRITLCTNSHAIGFLIHRLVAKAFIHNPNNQPEVNHIDENIENNHVENLEWVTSQQNSRHGTNIERMRKALIERGSVAGENNGMYGRTGSKNPNSKPVIQYDMQGNFIAEYASASCPGRKFGYNPSSISGAARGNYKQAYGYMWKYKNQD